MMVGETKKIPSRSYDSVDSHDEASTQEYNLNGRKRWLLAVSTIIGVFFLYLFCFLLPSIFIPKSCSLYEISKVQSLNITLHPFVDHDLDWAEDTRIRSTYNQGNLRRQDDTESLSASFEGNIEAQAVKHESSKQSRLVVVGDIHGQRKELHKLLAKISYNRESDTLLVLGDFISKGPHSIEVIDDLIDWGAKCILGNHEYYVLQHYASFHGLEGPRFAGTSPQEVDQAQLSTANDFNDDPEFLLAKKLQPRHVTYINSCPVMMLLGEVPLHSKESDGGADSGKGVAVHAGLRWDLTQHLDQQIPLECLEMRAYRGPFFNESTDDPYEDNAVSWSKIWNAKHKESADDSYVVYYGHDAHRGLSIKRWAKGLDTGCTKGGALSAMVMWQELSKDGRIFHKERVISVDC